jgi:hypothetical protein
MQNLCINDLVDAVVSSVQPMKQFYRRESPLCEEQHAALLAMEADELLNDIRPSLDLIDDTSVSMEHTTSHWRDDACARRGQCREQKTCRHQVGFGHRRGRPSPRTIDDYIYDDNILVDDPDLEMPEDIANLPPGLAFH